MATEITLAEAQAQLALWITANAAISVGRSYTITSGGIDRTLEREDADTCQRQITYWSRIVDSLKQQAANHSTPGFRVAKWT